MRPSVICFQKPAHCNSNVRFGQAVPKPGFLVHKLDRTVTWLSDNRTREMLVEDVVGFGILRGMMDLGREYFYKLPENEKPKPNWPACRERSIREVASILTDNVLGGILAYGIAALWNRTSRTPNAANLFISNQTRQFFQSILDAPHPTGQFDQTVFIKKVAHAIAGSSEGDRPHQVQAISKLLARALTETGHNSSGAHYDNIAVELARQLGAKTTLAHTVTHPLSKGPIQVALNELVEDTARFIRLVNSHHAPYSTWKTTATGLLKQTTKVNRLRLPIALTAALASTFTVPYLNRFITEKIDHISSYPGEIGLKQQRRVMDSNQQPWYQRLFPYFSQTLQRANPGPVIASLIPLLVPFGIVDTNSITAGRWKSIINWPFQKGFLHRAVGMLQFGKRFPFTTQQQMAACFALLITSRLSAARDGNEFRERLVDSGGGWMVWILGTPFLKRKLAQWLDSKLPSNAQKAGATLLRPDKTLKSAVEIKRLLPAATQISPCFLRKLMDRYTFIQFGSLAASIVILGIVEPFIGIKLTEWSADREQSRSSTR